MAQSELSLQQNPNFSNIQDLASTNDHYESEKKNIDSIFVLKDSINNETVENDYENNNENLNNEKKTIEIELVLQNRRPVRQKKQRYVSQKKNEQIPKHFRKTKKSSKKNNMKNSLQKRILNNNKISQNNYEIKSPKIVKDSPTKEIHLKEEENSDQKLFYHSYLGFSTIIDYLGKFEWFNNASFQNKQLPIKYLSPICFWFITCYNYFPRYIFTKNIGHFVESTMQKCSKIVLETKIRLNKNLIKSTHQNFNFDEDRSEFLDNNFWESLNNALIKSVKPFLNDNVQKLYEKKQFQKINYTTEDDLFLIQVKNYLASKTFEIYQMFKNYNNLSSFDNLLSSSILSSHLDTVNIDKIEELTCNEIIENNLEATKQSPENHLEAKQPLENIEPAEDKILPEETKNQSPLETKIENNENKLDLLTPFIAQELTTIPKEDHECYEKIDKNSKKISLTNLINLYSMDLSTQQKENESIIKKLKETMEKEKKIQEIFNYEEIRSDEMLYDVSFFTKDEQEYLNLLENKQQSAHYTKTTPTKDFEKNDTKIKVYNHTDDTVCQICNDGDYIEENLIVFCSKCNISVHQFCYGILVIPHGDWICDLCKDIGQAGKYLRCPLCQEIGGAMKKSVLTCESQLFINLNPSFHEFLKKCQKTSMKSKPLNLFDENQEPTPFEVWTHVTCVLWLPETYFVDKLTYSNVRGLENIDTKKFDAFCVICQSANSGACVQCAKNKCQISFHPECARRAKLYMEVKFTDKLNYYIYCEKHTPLKLKRLLENKEKKYQEEIIKFSRTIEKYYETYNSEHKMRATQLLKSKKIFKKFCTKLRLEQTKDTKHFLSTLKEHYNSFEENKFVVYLIKNETHNDNENDSQSFEVLDSNIPKTKFSFIPRQDDLWKTFFYKSLNPEQIYKKYYSISKRFNSWRQQLIQPKLENIEIKKEGTNDDSENIKRSLTKISFKHIENFLENPEKLYCVCKKPYGEGEKMMECEMCLEWFHFECIGYSGTLEEAENFKFTCPECYLQKKSISKQSITPEKKKKTPEKIGEENLKKLSKEKIKTSVSKKKEKTGTPNKTNENLPVCKRTRKQSLSSLARISSSTPRKEKSSEKKKTNVERKIKKIEEKRKAKKEKKENLTKKEFEKEENLQESRKTKRKNSENLTKKIKK